jgi:hypothetical protein
MSKIGALVLCHSAPLIIDKVIGLLGQDCFRFFLHVDKKLNISDYVSAMKNAGQVAFIEDRITIFWGGFGMVEAEIALAEAALADPEISSFVLISDDTVPLRPPAEIHAALAAAPDRIVCAAKGRTRKVYDEFYFLDAKFSSLRGRDMNETYLRPEDFERFERMVQLRRRGKKPLETLYFGRQWWSLSRHSLQAIVRLAKEDDWLLESFRFSACPDETFFQTCFRLCFPQAPVLDLPTYNDWSRPAARPWVFSTAEDLRATKFDQAHLFARKIRRDLPELVDVVTERWHSG